METVYRIGQGFDSHRLVVGRKLVLGGVGIEHSSGLEGNSDADVLCHAIMDAMLGAVAAGDIGTHFPDDVSEWTGACSIDLMTRVMEIVADKGAYITNIDSTVIAEEPKLKDYIHLMRSNIAEAVGLSDDCVSVKATTAERMGAIGKKEGIAAMAVVMVGIKE
ncbi:2-C-methyl-D-erythritol 2,4-cyclodiphosphate synthase [bacterium E08(2017)]|nr:2-C-methyl-D-erythritol 2,4-cyclodiphosphate synthase [bacterium E08(2017)]